MEYQYSIAVCPPANIINQVRLLKLELAGKIGWFNSKDADAHITFNVFEANDEQLILWKKCLTTFCKAQSDVEISLTGTGFFPFSKAFYLSPEDNSKKQLEHMMKAFNKVAPFGSGELSKPHMTIGRRLEGNKINAAIELFGNREFDLKFTCDNLAIRKLNKDVGQYFVESRFDFGNQKELLLF